MNRHGGHFVLFFEKIKKIEKIPKKKEILWYGFILYVLVDEFLNFTNFLAFKLCLEIRKVNEKTKKIFTGQRIRAC